MRKSLVFAALAISACTQTLMAPPASAQEAGHPEAQQSVVFAGAGKQSTGSSPAWTIGYLYLPLTSPWTIGLDFAGEGTSRNNTTGNNNTTEQAFSLNLLAGRSLQLGHEWRMGAAAVVGGRTTNKECASSYLGYQCYADTNPSVSYAVNFGGLAHLSYKQVLLGARGTGESGQVLVGLLF